MNEETGEILVIQDAHRSGIELHIRGNTPDEYRVVRLPRLEARRLAALILYQAETLSAPRQQPAPADLEGEARLRTA